jgi:hypothetical protein
MNYPPIFTFTFKVSNVTFNPPNFQIVAIRPLLPFFFFQKKKIQKNKKMLGWPRGWFNHPQAAGCLGVAEPPPRPKGRPNP